ncbi:MAG TPA: hypothetical protein VFY02_11640, partial [Gaiellaceae bacterium]|nr:hypothetical protein [Gaiellaceae bacterium]
LLATTGEAFTDAMGTGLLVAAAIAAVAAVLVARYLPAREAIAIRVDATEPERRPLSDSVRAA